MWPLDLPASEVLRLSGESVIPWAVFDASWYLLTYPRIAAAVQGDSPSVVLEYYLKHGQTQGHSPNRMFDEQWHRMVYPQISERVAAGHYMSAFDAYCRRGALDRSAHWLFDELGYRDRYPDLTNDVLAATGILNGYDHYLRHGIEEGRIGHLLFDPEIYLAHFDSTDITTIRGSGVFQNYLKRIETSAPELRTSIYFDPAWYAARYPEVVREIREGRWKCALHHYLCNKTPTAFDPLESFAESWYSQGNAGLQEAIALGSFRNGYMHFLRFGARELRSPTASIDLGWYATQPSVRADLQQGRAPNAYAHWLTTGCAAGLRSQKPDTESVSEQQANHLFHAAAVALLPIAGRFGYDFAVALKPIVSVVMVVRNGFAATMATVSSLRSSTTLDIELIIVDCGSGDEIRSISQYVRGAKVIRFDMDIEWSRAADAGRQFASAIVVLFLSNQAQIAFGSVQRAYNRLAEDKSAGAVGGMVLQMNGVVAQAGGILWRDGEIQDYQRGASALKPEANFVRTVDFCSPGFLLVRAKLLSELNGFDDKCADGYETVDLCIRIAQAGSRVVYDPSVMIISADPPRSTKRPGDYFGQKHATLLSKQYLAGGTAQVFARHAGTQPHRVLFIEDTVPLRRIGSGFVRANDLIRIMASLGCAVTVFPINGCDHDLALIYFDMPEQVEVMHTLSFDDLTAFLDARPNYYDTIWIARTHNLARVRSVLARLTRAGGLNARVILDTEAVTPHREAMRADIAGVPYDLEANMQAIRADADICQQTVAVTWFEAESLRQHGFPHVCVIGHMIKPNPSARSFAQRSGLLFVGAIHQDDSPNLDSLMWFVDAVLPLIEAELKWETKLTIAGYVAPGVDLSRFEHHSRITLRGPVFDLDPLYDAHRVFVAPTRFAAGAPYKVLEAASRGVPVVATEILRAELGWTENEEIVAAGADEPAALAAAIIRLYRNEVLWRIVREGALRRLERDNGNEQYANAVASVLRLPSPFE